MSRFVNHDPVVALVDLIATRLESGQPTTTRTAAIQLGWSKGTTGTLYKAARKRGWLTDDHIPTQAGLEATGRI